MDWAHKVDERWLEARKNVITATELQSLMVGKSKWTKAQKAGEEIAPAFAALWGMKHSSESLDPWSYGAAARGHIMEPYAVKEYNANYFGEYFWWDDCIICNNGLGFSPDAMNVEQPKNSPAAMHVVRGSLIWNAGHSGMPTPESILEIKSYNASNHMKCIIAKQKTLKERYQIAVAMMVLPQLKYGTLVFYNPNVEYNIATKVYNRLDLEKEIEELSEVLDMWNKTCRYFNSVRPTSMGLPLASKCTNHFTEEQIYQEYVESQPSNTMMFN